MTDQLVDRFELDLVARVQMANRGVLKSQTHKRLGEVPQEEQSRSSHCLHRK